MPCKSHKRGAHRLGGGANELGRGDAEWGTEATGLQRCAFFFNSVARPGAYAARQSTKLSCVLETETERVRKTPMENKTTTAETKKKSLGHGAVERTASYGRSGSSSESSMSPDVWREQRRSARAGGEDRRPLAPRVLKTYRISRGSADGARPARCACGERERRGGARVEALCTPRNEVQPSTPRPAHRSPCRSSRSMRRRTSFLSSLYFQILGRKKQEDKCGCEKQRRWTKKWNQAEAPRRRNRAGGTPSSDAQRKQTHLMPRLPLRQQQQ